MLGRLRFIIVLAAAFSLVGCAFTDQVLQPGWRHVVFTVENDSARPAQVFVATVGDPMGAVVGTANPATVPPNSTTDVTLGFPPDGDWGIFLNPGNPQGGGLMLNATDVPPDFTGRAPVTFTVDAGGSVGSMVPGTARGWMGNP